MKFLRKIFSFVRNNKELFNFIMIAEIELWLMREPSYGSESDQGNWRDNNNNKSSFLNSFTFV